MKTCSHKWECIRKELQNLGDKKGYEYIAVFMCIECKKIKKIEEKV